MNDPNGISQWGQDYHLFYQYNPVKAGFGLMHWGHAVSQDMIHWKDLPLALTPSPGPDETGCWSGCVVNNDGVPTMVYTGTRGERYQFQSQCIATSRDGLLTWEKFSGNPVLSGIPPEARQDYDFRDPYVWREGDTWYLVLASRIDKVGGCCFLYRSPDLIQWEYLNPLVIGDLTTSGSVWECPSFFPLGDKWVLILGGKGNIPFTTFYFIGDYVDHHFIPEAQGVYDYANFYAPLSMKDDSGRRLLYGWLIEARPDEALLQAGWAGAHAIPRELTLRNGRLNLNPIAEVESLRGERVDFANLELSDQDRVLNVQGLAQDIVAEFEATGAVGLALACAPDGSEETRVTYDPATKKLTVNREKASLTAVGETTPNEAPHELRPGENLRLRILLDGSILEIIANERTSICSRIYPSHDDSQGVAVFGTGVLKSMSIWQMASIWPE
jgi:beta-fructofuranosidase